MMTGKRLDRAGKAEHARTIDGPFRPLYEQSTEAIFIVEKTTGRYLDANPAAEKLTGYPLAVLQRLLPTTILRMDEKQWLESVRLSTTRKEIGEVVYSRSDGSERIARLSMVPMNAAAVFVIVRDISEFGHHLEKQIQEAQKLESISVLAGGMAHDFNNILFPISGMCELLMEDLPEGSLEHESVLEIYQAAKRAGDLVKQILSFSRRTEHEKMPTRIQQMLKEIAKLVRSTIPSNIEIVYEIQNNCPPVMADPTQLHHIVMNLITNAYQAMETTRGRITVSLKSISVEEGAESELTLPPGKYAQFSVADTGCGIDPGIMDKIFEPYFTTKAQGKGTGLGLSVVYGIVKDHQGDIRVSSRPGKGTAMVLFFPVLDSEVDVEGYYDQPGASGAG